MGKTQAETHNDNVRKPLKRGYNDIVRGKPSRRVRTAKVDSIADTLVRKFKAPNSRLFFCKCAWKMSEDEIWSVYEQAHSPKINSPLKYFITLCQIKMDR